MDKLFPIMAVTLITWLGLFAYLFMIDRSLRRMEQNEKEQDNL